MAYTKVFTNPHPNGWDNPSERPPITADVLQAHTDAIQAIDNYLAAGGGTGGGSGGDYVLPVATSTILGGVKVDGDTIAVTADGTISVTAEAGAVKNTSDLTNDGSGSGSYFVEASELAQVAFTGQYSDLKNKITKTSQLTNDSNFLSTIPKATTTTLGGIKLDGETLSMNSDGVVSVSAGTGGSSFLADLEDTNIKVPIDKQFLIYNEEESKWLNQTLNIPNNLTDLGDVDLPSEMIQNGDVLTYNSESSTWVNQSLDLGAGSRELTLAEYDALSTEEKNNDTTYFITDAENVDLGSVGTAGTLKPWLYNSDKEVVIGVYDGKPLYRKVYCIENQVISSNEIVINTDVSSEVEKCVKVSSSIYDSLNSSWMLLPFKHPNYPIELYVDGGSVVHLIFNSAYTPYDRITKIYITIEYTKTTDAEGSGTNLMPYSFVQNASNIYSTEEQVVGRWIDGKPLYQKTLEVTIPETTTNGTYVEAFYSISENIEHAHIQSSYVFQEDNNRFSVPYITNEGYVIKAQINVNNDLRILNSIVATSNAYALFTIQYTKTTD